MTTDDHLTPEPSHHTVLTPEQWRPREAAHRDAVAELTAGHRERRARGERHPVWDFMFTYYLRA